MNADTYRSIGLAYAEVERREPFVLGARPVADVGVVSHEAVFGDNPSGDHAGRTNHVDKGLSRVLTELGVLHDFIDGTTDFARYRVIALPDTDALPADLVARLQAHLKAGGRVLLAYKGLLAADTGKPWLAGVGRLEGPSPHDVNYIKLRPAVWRAAEDAGRWFPQGAFRGPAEALLVRPARGALALADLHRPYFNRTRRHFCSHRNTPDAGPTGAPAALAGRDWAWLAQPLFTAYADEGQRLYRDLVGQALAHLLPEPTVETSLPSQGKVALTEQPRARRHVLHLVYGAPIKRGALLGVDRTPGDIEVIEDLPPIHDVRVTVRPPRPVARLTLEPEGAPLEFTSDAAGAIHFVVPQVACAQLVALHWKS